MRGLLLEISLLYHCSALKGVALQVALKWIWQHGIPLTTKSSSLQHLAEDLDLFAWALSDAEMSKLDSSTTPAGTPSFMCSS